MTEEGPSQRGDVPGPGEGGAGGRPGRSRARRRRRSGGVGEAANKAADGAPRSRSGGTAGPSSATSKTKSQSTSGGRPGTAGGGRSGTAGGGRRRGGGRGGRPGGPARVAGAGQSKPGPSRREGGPSGAAGDGARRAGRGHPSSRSGTPNGASAPAKPPPLAKGPSDAENAAAVRANRRRVQVLCVGAGLMPGVVVGAALWVVVGVVAGVAAGAATTVVAAAWLARSAVSTALGMIGGRPLGADEEPRLATLVEGLCATFGVARPDLWLVEDAVPNACALARLPGRAVLVVTRGLLATLDLIEMEGVVAHELAHLKRHDAVVSAVAIATVGQVVRLTGDDRLVHLAVGRGREYGADRAAVLAVRYPPGLAGALGVLERGPAPDEGSVFTGRRWAVTRWVWIDPMVGARAAAVGEATVRVAAQGLAPVGEIDATAARREALAEW